VGVGWSFGGVYISDLRSRNGIKHHLYLKSSRMSPNMPQNIFITMNASPGGGSVTCITRRYFDIRDEFS
jgi:hypothetical protein